MDPPYQYYNELRARQPENYDLARVCFDFTKLLKTVSTDRRDEISDWFFALIVQHRIITEKVRDPLPYKPRLTKGIRGRETLSYSLNKLPEVLQEVLLQYMLDCLTSQVL